MNIEVIKEKLSKKYVVDHFIDLNDIDSGQSYSILYSILDTVKQDQFPDNYRIVFYYNKPLKKTFLDCPYDVLDYLQKVLCYYDIPNFFVIIVTDDKIPSDDLEYLRQKYATDDNNCISLMIVPNFKK